MRCFQHALFAIGISATVIGAATQLSLAAITDLNKIPQKDVCRNGVVNTRLYVSWVLENFGVSRSCIDKNEDGSETYSEKKQLLTVSGYNEKRCNPDKVFNAQLLSDLMAHPPEDVTTYASTPIDLGASLAKKRTDIIEGRVRVKCIAKKAPTKPPAGATQQSRSDGSQLNGGLFETWKIKLRGEQTDLEYEQGTSAFKKASSGKISVLTDNLADETEYYSKAVVGIDTGRVDVGDIAYQFIPYIKGERKFKNTKGKQGDIDKLGVGVISHFKYFGLHSPVHFAVSFDPQYLTDTLADTEILGATVRLQPEIRLSENTILPGGTKYIGDLAYDWDVIGIARYSHVFDDGGDAELIGKRNYLYVGPEIKLHLTSRAGTLFDRFGLTLGYHYLFKFEGTHEKIQKYSSKLTYQIDEKGLFDFSIGYENGRDLEKFTDVEQYKTTFGVKF